MASNANGEIIEVKKFLDKTFKIKDLGSLKYFLRIEVVRNGTGIHINQRKYALDILLDCGLLGGKPSKIPMEENIKISR